MYQYIESYTLGQHERTGSTFSEPGVASLSSSTSAYSLQPGGHPGGQLGGHPGGQLGGHPGG